MDSLSFDNLYELGMNMWYPDLIRSCTINRNFNQLCNNESFWRNYNRKWFFLEQSATNRSFKETAQRAYLLLKIIWSQNGRPTSRVLKYIINMDIKEFQNDLGRVLIPTAYFEFINIGYISKMSNDNSLPILDEISEISHEFGDYLSNSNFDINEIKSAGRKITNRTEKDLAVHIVQFIYQPTIYLTPNGPIIIEYDDDARMTLMNVNATPQNMQDFVRNFTTSINIIQISLLYNDILA